MFFYTSICCFAHCSYYLEVESLMFVFYISVTNSTVSVVVEEVEEAAELAWRARAFITQPFVMELVVVFILVCILFPSIYPNICFVHSISMIQHACIFVKHLIIISSF